MSTHPCPREGCPKQLPSSTLACKPHWFLVPPQLRRDVQEAWRSGDFSEYILLRQQAVEAMNRGST